MLVCPRFSHLSPRQHTLFSVSFLSLIFCNAMTDLGYLLGSLTLETRCRVALSYALDGEHFFSL